MFNIQSAMLALLGFLVAILLVLLLAPAYWRRAVRLTTNRIKQAMPLTEAEIRADKDRLRAEYAIKVHRLEVKAEHSTLASARQQIELNRRDAAISQLEGEIGRLKTSLEEHENARRVLEQTITDRFPMLEQRLSVAQKQLSQRERELSTVTESTGRNSKALEEASQLNAQQRDEIMRLNSSLAALSARTREGLNDPKFTAEVALRTELETLRAKLRDQSALLQQAQTGGGLATAAALAGTGAKAGSHELEQALVQARSEIEAAQSAKSLIEAEIAKLKSAFEDQSVELASAKAALAAYERGSAEERSVSLKDSRLAMKVRIGALQAESQQQSAAIQRMRTELAAANEKLAKQAAHFMAEMRRLGTAGGAGAVPPSRREGPVRRVVSEISERRSKVAKLGEMARPLQILASAPVSGDAAGAPTPGDAQESSRVRGFLKALGGASAVRAGASVPAEPAEAVAAAAGGDDRSGTAQPSNPDSPRRLVDRLAKVSKT